MSLSQDAVVLCSDIIGQVVVQDEAQEAIQQRQINFLIDFGEHSFHHHDAFALACFPNICQIVDALTPLS